MSETSSNTVELRDVAVATPGARLKSARESFNYRIDDVARHMRLKPEVIDLIEQDAFDDLNRSAVFIRGYLRGYANLVGQSGDEIIALFNAAYEPEPEEKPALEGHKHNIVSRDKPIRWVNYVVIIGVVAVGMLWWKNQKVTTGVVPAKIVDKVEPAAPKFADVDLANRDSIPHSHDTLKKGSSFVVKDRNPARRPSRHLHQQFSVD